MNCTFDNFSDFGQNIGLQPENIAFLKVKWEEMSDIPTFSDIFEKAEQAALSLDEKAGVQIISDFANENGLSYYTTECLILLFMGYRAKPRYTALHLRDEQYYINMYDIVRWVTVCKRETGEVGTFRNFGWLMHPMVPRIIKLGRLQFELCQRVNGQMQFAFPDKPFIGEPVLNIHIPEGEPLHPDACRASFAKAAKFFPEVWGITPAGAYCSSWLLSPELKPVLPKGSNIGAFMEFFELIDTYPNSDAEWRIFGNKRPYPQNTALQRSAAPFFTAGGTMRTGVGRLKDGLLEEQTHA